MRRVMTVAAIVGAAIALARVNAAPSLEPLSQDRGATGAWQKLLKLRTIASVMHTTAHPDDEHGALLAMLGRGEGARVTLLTLTRGEAGDNAIGSELFDALGLIRTEELLRADQYYGVDQQYFTSVVDYGFSKRLEEALVKWGRENVVRDVVRIIRMDRPLVVIARFQGNERDGHGNHQTAGLITQDAYRVAGDPAAFPDQIREGLRPWQPLKLYMGGVRENEDWTIRVDSSVYSPWLGDSYANFARIGLGFQRSQNSGRTDPLPGPAYTYYKRIASQVSAAARETSFFDGIDTSVTGMFTALKRPPPAAAPALVGAIQREVDAAVRAFTLENPSASVPSLAKGLAATRDAIRELSADLDVVHMLRLKEQQFVDAINTALGIEFSAVAQVTEPVVRGQTFDVRLQFMNHGTIDVDRPDLRWSGPGFGGFSPRPGVSSHSQGARPPQSVTETVQIRVPADAPFTRPYFSRQSIADNRYAFSNAAAAYFPSAEPPFTAAATYRVASVPVTISAPVIRREAQLPYGSVAHRLAIVPAIAVNVAPRLAIVPRAAAKKTVAIKVELTSNTPGGSSGQLALRLPEGWTSNPSTIPFTLKRPGEKSRFELTVAVPAIEDRDYRIDAVATVNGIDYTEGYDVIEHRDLETAYLYHDAASQVRGVDVKIAPGLDVGYIMGVGDDVPSGIAQLGARVRLLNAQDLATGNLAHFDAIMTGTRAYAVRDDLRTSNRRLLDYVKDGGNLIVLYNTPAEFDPNAFAPFPALLPRNAEEVSEEDSPVTILSPSRPEFTTPNAISTKDFDGWVEQRGSKFFSEWNDAYTAMIETHDQGQPPQRGGWLTATYGKGHYTYFAYAFHRQLPYGVPGAYRLLANLLSLGRSR